MSADTAAADAAVADAAAERRLNHSIPRTYFVRGIQLTIFIFIIQGEPSLILRGYHMGGSVI